MSEEITILSSTKEDKYKELIPQLEGLIASENDLVANLANITSALKMSFDFFWVGFYRVIGQELVLGPFQGTIACTRIAFGRGVCGTAWKEKKTILVEDVGTFPGHIACSSASKSEIVVPIYDLQKNIVLILDIDSDRYADFDQTDAYFLEKIADIISHKL
jgi:L-methionine (R)-S-oxide reductase